MSPPLFEVCDLRIAVYDAEAGRRGVDHGLTSPVTGAPLGPGWLLAVPGVSFTVAEGEVLALVGESGSGKTLTMLGSLGLLATGACAIGGSVTYRGQRIDLWATPGERGVPDTRGERRRRRRRATTFMGELLDDEWRRVMGTEIGVLFQDPVASWAPDEVVGRQTTETLAAHTTLPDEEIERRVLDALGEVRLPGVGAFMSFRHELSRGQAQRAMLAAALVKAPSLLVADEPLSGLDVSVAGAIIDLLRDLRTKRGLAMVMATHDIASIASIADRVAVVYGGQIVEHGPVDDVFHAPTHPYTEGLLGSIPGVGRERLRPIAGSPPRLVAVARDRCGFAERCPYRQPVCLAGSPQLGAAARSWSRCVRTAELQLRGVPG